MLKKISYLAILLAVATVVYSANGTPSTLTVKTDSTGALVVDSSATPTPPYFYSVFNNTRLKTDASGNLVVATSGGGGGTPGGSDTQIQYNNAGAFGGVPGFTYNGTQLGIPDNDQAASTVAVTKGGLLWMHNFSPAGADGGNVFLGINSGNLTTGSTGASSSENTAVGYHTLISLNEGYRNTIMGYLSAPLITNGHYNSCYGALSCGSMVTATFNTGIGYNALGTTIGFSNSVVGHFAMSDQTTGFQNSCLGQSCLGNLTDGNDTVALGYIAGRNINAGPNNLHPAFSIYIGNSSRGLNNNDSYQAVIGASALGGGSYTSTFGSDKSNISFSTGDAPTCASGCGTSVPTWKGNNSYFTITLGTTPSSPFVVTFDTDGAFIGAPQCFVQMGKPGMVVGKMILTVDTSSITTASFVTNGTAPASGDIYHVHCAEGR